MVPCTFASYGISDVNIIILMIDNENTKKILNEMKDFEKI